jgi:hypothetical protein
MPMKRDAEAPPTLAVLEQTPIILEKILAGATADALGWKPAPDRWSIGEVLAHLVDVEQVFRTRAKRMVEEKDPELEAYDQNAAYDAGKYSSGSADEHLRQFCHERDLTVSWLRYIPAGQEARTARHAELGKITLGELMNEWAFHDLGHVKQVSELYRARAFYPRMGGFQRYYTVKP